MKKAAIFIFLIMLIGFFFSLPLFAGGAQEEEVTQLQVEKQERIYIAPQNPEADKQELVLSPGLIISEGRVVKRYELTIFDSAGNEVFTVAEETTETRGFFGRLFGSEKPSVTLPDTLRWEGVDNDGNFVEDDDYVYQVTITDSEGNVAKTPPLGVTVDNTPPAIDKISAEYKIFSPNDDGLRDTLLIEQSGSREIKWEGTITDSEGNTVKTYTWVNENRKRIANDVIPPDFTWNGTDEDGETAEDGTYTYTLTGTDRAGNRSSQELTGIRVSTEAGDITLNPREYDAFSPNNDGVQDVINFEPDITDPVDIADWTFRIQNTAGKTRMSRSGDGMPPDPITFDGYADDGELLNDGTYYAILQIQYVNGNIVESQPTKFTIDTAAPRAVLSADPRVFGGAGKESVEIYAEMTPQDPWIGIIEYEEEQVISEPLSEYGITGESFRYAWYGNYLDGTEAPDGTYTAYLEAVDEAGNRGTSNMVKIRKDTRKTPIDVTVDKKYFSPDGDGNKDYANVDLQYEVDDSIENFLVSILDDEERPVRTLYKRQAFPSFRWDGRTNGGIPVPEGEYMVNFEVVYENGNHPKAQAGPVVVDTTDPDIMVQLEYNTFSPNDDGERDTIQVRQDSSTEDTWTGVLLDSEGNEVMSESWEGEAPDFTWDGRGPEGEILPDGVYTYRISAEDKAGNAGSARVQVRIDTKEREVTIIPEVDGFSPNGDGYRDQIEFSIQVKNPDLVESWQLDLADTLFGTRHAISGDTAIPERISWDGVSKDGRIYDGRYYARLKVTYENGSAAEGLSDGTFILDATPPDVMVNIKPLPLSPDGDGYNDAVNIGIDVEEKNVVDSWSLRIISPEGQTFVSLSGSGRPGTRMWDGKNADGELVEPAMDYTVRITVTDELRNTGTADAVLRTDLFVTEGGKVIIPNIHFAPNTDDFFYFDEELAAQNIETLQKIAKVLNRNPDYEITVIGHTVMVYWAYPEKGQIEQREVLIPLSIARAREVKKALGVLGVDRYRVETKGMGGTEPVVPHGDLENRWKNRRAEFNLMK